MADEQWKLDGSPATAKETDGGKWVVIAVDHDKRKVNIDGNAQEVNVTVMLMHHTATGDMKTWEARGNFTLEQAQAMPIPAGV